MLDVEEFNQEEGIRIKVIGVGGVGNDAVAYLIKCGVQGVQFICADTDARTLSRGSAHNIRLGGNGLEAGDRPKMGRKAAEAAMGAIREAITDAHLLFIITGIGGASSAASVITRAARDMGIFTVGMVISAFDWTGYPSFPHGIDALEINVDSLIVVTGEKVVEMPPDKDIAPMAPEAFTHIGDVLKNVVGGISAMLIEHGLVCIDFEDVRTVLNEPGRAMMGMAVASGPDRARLAAEKAVLCPLLGGIELSCAKGVLVLVSGSKESLRLRELNLAINTIRVHVSPSAHTILGTTHDDSLGDEIRVIVIATGLPRREIPAS